MEAEVLDDMDRTIPYQQSAAALGVSERTLDAKLKQLGIPVVRVSPRSKALRLGHHRALLKACEA